MAIRDPATARAPLAASVGSESVVLTYNRLLGARLYLHTWVRLFVAFTIIAGALVGKYVVGITELDVPRLMLLGVIIAGYNAFAWFISRKFRTPERSAGAYRFLLNVMYATIVLDFLALTVAVWLVGGSRSPFLVFYLLHVILSCILLSRRAAIVSTLLAYLLLASLVVGETSGVIESHTPAGATAVSVELDWRYALTVLVVYGALFGLAGFLLMGLSDLLRRGERELHDANVELDRLSKMRRDFLHIALHDLQAPIGALSGLLGNLRDGLCGDLNERQAEWVRRSLARLDGLNTFIRDLQMLTELDSADLEPRFAEVDVNALLRDVVEEHRDLARLHEHALELEAPDTLPPVRGLSRLLGEALGNFVTNAIKYTPKGGRIIVRGVANSSFVRVEVEDNGVGIAEEDQARLFDEFVRVHRTSDVAAAPGTGLGLSIVRRIIERHHGRVGVESEPGEGSTFYVELPRVGNGGQSARS
jgi:signal transduction histidine kinase